MMVSRSMSRSRLGGLYPASSLYLDCAWVDEHKAAVFFALAFARRVVIRVLGGLMMLGYLLIHTAALRRRAVTRCR
jgi:hypothetical protein